MQEVTQSLRRRLVLQVEADGERDRRRHQIGVAHRRQRNENNRLELALGCRNDL